jgi:hypothetical protein
MNEIKKPETPREALELAYTLFITAPSHEKMIAAGKIMLDIARTMPQADVLEVMDMVEGRLDTMERVVFGNVVDQLKPH